MQPVWFFMTGICVFVFATFGLLASPRGRSHGPFSISRDGNLAGFRKKGPNMLWLAPGFLVFLILSILWNVAFRLFGVDCLVCG